MSDLKLLDAFSDFRSFAAAWKARPGWKQPLGFGIGRVTYGQKGNIINIAIPALGWGGVDDDYFAVYMAIFDSHGIRPEGNEFIVKLSRELVNDLTRIFAHLPDKDPHAQAMAALYSAWNDGKLYEGETKARPLFRFIALLDDAPCQSLEAVYIKLLGLSYGYAKPRTLNLDGIFGILPNLAWSGNRPYELDWLRDNKARLQLLGQYPAIDAVDKIPLFLHHVIPADNTRILDATKVRLGAHISPGTTVMPGASYINFNAGTLGPSMVEGRISSSATIGPGTDVGGGASILGTLSGGNKTPIIIGANCLLGANSVCGIPLGDGCVIDAGVSVLPGSKVTIKNDDIRALAAINEKKLDSRGRNIFKASELSGFSGVHFRLDTATGTLVAFRSKFEIKLNEALHQA
jgi:2,3,4,5-tetrahydropyridine-2,6-dicarboxylate N-succinyltransferase